MLGLTLWDSGLIGLGYNLDFKMFQNSPEGSNAQPGLTTTASADRSAPWLSSGGPGWRVKPLDGTGACPFPVSTCIPSAQSPLANPVGTSRVEGWGVNEHAPPP